MPLPNEMPLPQTLSNSPPKKYSSGMHAGLFYNRFVHGWHYFGSDRNLLSFSSYKPNGQKDSVIPAKNWVNQLHGKDVGNSLLLNAYATRQKQLLAQLDGRFLVAETDWHFATGLGNNHPVENGFAWHPTLGVPYLTGAGVKGLLRAWCEKWASFDPETQRLWFGPSLDELSPPKGSNIVKQNPSAGELIFFDAIPTGPVKLKADVMTPHMGKWYENGDSDPTDPGVVPADWHSPKPVPFLVVDKGQSFLFSVAKRATEAASPIQLDEVKTQLIEALKHLGAGAKTAVGYGRMCIDEKAVAAERLAHDIALKAAASAALKANIAREKTERQKDMSAIECELDDWSLLPQTDAESQTKSLLERALHANKSDQKLIAQALKAFYEKAGTWAKRGSKKHDEKICKIKEILL